VTGPRRCFRMRPPSPVDRIDRALDRVAEIICGRADGEEWLPLYEYLEEAKRGLCARSDRLGEIRAGAPAVAVERSALWRTRGSEVRNVRSGPSAVTPTPCLQTITYSAAHNESSPLGDRSGRLRFVKTAPAVRTDFSRNDFAGVRLQEMSASGAATALVG
jgi:hypothetical protein